MRNETRSLAPERNISWPPEETPRMVAVLGPFRGGTSVVTGILRTLGVFVGHHFFDCGSTYSTFEAVALREACLRCFDERPGRWQHIEERQARVAHLRAWGAWARDEGAQLGHRVSGGKHPIMCKLIPELCEAWRSSDGKPPLLISVVRPAAEVISAWDRARDRGGAPWWPRPDRAEVVHDLIASRDAAIADWPHIKINFAELRAQPRRVVEQLVADCQLPLDVDRATAMVRRPI